MAFEGEAFVARFNTVWNGHDLDGILAMMTEDVVFEASFGKDPWGARVGGEAAVRGVSPQPYAHWELRSAVPRFSGGEGPPFRLPGAGGSRVADDRHPARRHP